MIRVSHQFPLIRPTLEKEICLPKILSRWRRAVGGGMVLGALSFVLTATGAPWVQTTSLPEGFSDHTMVYASGFLYLAGGFSPIFGESERVFYSQVQSNGTIGAWNVTTPMPAKIFAHASVAANGFVYVLGGYHYTDATGYQLTNAVYYSQINSNGTLGTWQTATPLPQPAYFFSASVWSNRIYCIGGWNGQADISNVYSATIQADGSLSAWVTQRSLPVAIYTHAGVANGMLYVLGGAINDGSAVQNKVYYAAINADCTLGIWNQTTPLPESFSGPGAVAANGRVFVMGGSVVGGSATKSLYSAPVKGDGSLGSWSAGTGLPQELYYFGTAVSESHIFSAAGKALGRSKAPFIPWRCPCRPPRLRLFRRVSPMGISSLDSPRRPIPASVCWPRRI